ncbi:YheC/YheD family protein [Paenibacillus sp. P96]|uniref:YheC/YheD family protein n=1 Tax=Paenibacillus zeirhizosphaerae TaxID=2987519 RepID=A0ABT9FTT0_9BACL|nr:YheC/YheD family protein [Paenibacillus sp. P96]MDP4097901.1 YheC/YheD family protein [Paenibacillus sp. P96]
MQQPVLGIMTLYLNKAKQIEDRRVYQKMIEEGRHLGLDIFVFTPADVHPTRKLLLAHIYEPSQRRWTRKWRAFPQMVYDRCRIQKGARFQQLREFRSKYGHLIYLNRPLRNKWTIYEVLFSKVPFKPHLPETVLYRSHKDIESMLKKTRLLYLKPVNGTGGRGILRIEQPGTDDNYYVIQGRNMNRQIIPRSRVHRTRLEAWLRRWKLDHYLIQEGIPIELESGRVHDYRLLVQKNGQGKWEVTGCAGRVGPVRSVTSNLHGGGRAVPMRILLDHWVTGEELRGRIEEEAGKLGIQIATHLESLYGGLCELALDLAINKEGHIYLLEVNPKPSREVFARIGEKDTYKKAIVRPVEYALWLYRSKLAGNEPKKRKHTLKPPRRNKKKGPA